MKTFLIAMAVVEALNCLGKIILLVKGDGSPAKTPGQVAFELVMTIIVLVWIIYLLATE